MLSIRITDFALSDIAAGLGTVPPEQGGAMLGAPGADIVTSFIHDAPAVVSRVRYHNSDWLLQEIGQRERSGAERFKGIVHSHPSGMPEPSGQDRSEFGESLRLNAELGRYLAAIVTLTPEVDPAEHQLVLGPALFSFFGATWTGDALKLARLRPVVLPIRQSLARAGFDPSSHQPVLVTMDGSLVLGSRVTISGVGEATILFACDFPVIPPVLVEERHARMVPLRWNLSAEPQDRLAESLSELARRDRGLPVRDGDRGRRSAALPPASTGSAMQDRAERAASGTGDGRQDAAIRVTSPALPAEGGLGRRRSQTGLESRSWLRRSIHRWRNRSRTSQHEGLVGAEDEAADAGPLFARTAGLLSTQLRGKRVLIVGVGSVGSYLAEVLARSGVGSLELIDPDTVESVNLGRTIFAATDVGTAKINACALRLRAINPALSLRSHHADIGSFSTADLLGIIRAADVVIAATDDNAAQQRLNHLAYWAQKPAVFVGLYTGASGGEVIISREGLPCWECSTAGVRDTVGAVSVQPATNYGTGRLTAVPGLLTDIHLVSAAAAKTSLALLHDADDPARVGRFLDRPLSDGENYALFGTEPDYWFFPQIFEGTLGQHAFQSVWLRTPRRPDCPVCGPDADRTDPLAYGTGGSEPERLASSRAAYDRRRKKPRAFGDPDDSPAIEVPSRTGPDRGARGPRGRAVDGRQ